MHLPINIPLICLLIINFICRSCARSFWSLHPTAQHGNISMKICNCKVHEAVSGKLIKDHGALEKYSWPSADCHYVHQRCRAMCRQKLDLKTLNKEKTSLGYEYCSQYGQVSKGIDLVAEWTTHGCPHDMHLNSKKKVKLCCGHTAIPITGGKVVQAFGWNPDCKAQSFVLGN